MAVPTGGVLAAESISKALGDLMKGMFGVEQATPDIQGKIAQQGQAQRQEMLGMAQLPMQLEAERAKLGHTNAQTSHLGAQSENQLAQADLHRAQAGAVPSSMLFNQMRAMAQQAAAQHSAAQAQKLADDAKRMEDYRARVSTLDPSAKDYSAQLGKLLTEFDPRSPAIRELVKSDPLQEKKAAALDALTSARKALAASRNPDDPLLKAKVKEAEAHAQYWTAKTAEGKREQSGNLTYKQEQDQVAKLGKQAMDTVDRAFQQQYGKNFQSIPGTPLEKINAINWYKQYVLNNLLYMSGPAMHKYIDKDINPKNMPKALKELENQTGKTSSFEWLSSAASKVKEIAGGLWGSGQKAPIVTQPEAEPVESDEEESGGTNANDPLGILK